MTHVTAGQHGFSVHTSDRNAVRSALELNIENANGDPRGSRRCGQASTGGGTPSTWLPHSPTAKSNEEAVMSVADAARGQSCPLADEPASLRRRRMRGNQFVNVAREIASDNSLTFITRGLYVYLLAQLQTSDSFDAAAPTLAGETGHSVAEIDAALDELRERGFLIPEAGGFVLTDGSPADADEERTEYPRPPRQKDRPGLVYFAEREGLIKIGFTRFLEKRLKSLGSGGTMPPGMTVGPVKLLATEPGTIAREGELHERFGRWRLPGTEWFKPSPELRKYIKGLREGATV